MNLQIIIQERILKRYMESWLQPHPLLISTSWMTITTHGFLFALGAEVALLTAWLLLRARKIDTSFLLRKVALIFGVGLITARIGFFLLYPSAFESLGQVFSLWQGGLVSYFGLLAGVATAFFVTEKERRGEWFDAFSIALMIGWGIGRFGNYYAAESVGVESGVFDVFYGRVPIQIFESLLCFAIAWAALFLWKSRTYLPGKVALGVLAAYCAGRFLIDGWRDEDVFLFLRLGQIISLLGVVSIVLVKKRYVAFLEK